MYTRTPRLEIYPKRIEENAREVISMVHAHGAQVACVSKVLRAHPAILQAFINAGADMIGDSRLQNLAYVKEHQPDIPTLLLRLPALGQAADTVRYADYSLNSSLETLKQLSGSATQAGKVHKAILMVDVGDLREGIWPDRVLDSITDLNR